MLTDGGDEHDDESGKHGDTVADPKGRNKRKKMKNNFKKCCRRIHWGVCVAGPAKIRVKS